MAPCDHCRYNEQDKEDLQEESGWKLVHADVFRPPPNAIFLCASLGTGMQLLFCAAICILCAMLGFLSPANRGGLLTAMLLLFYFESCFIPTSLGDVAPCHAIEFAIPGFSA